MRSIFLNAASSNKGAPLYPWFVYHVFPKTFFSVSASGISPPPTLKTPTVPPPFCLGHLLKGGRERYTPHFLFSFPLVAKERKRRKKQSLFSPQLDGPCTRPPTYLPERTSVFLARGRQLRKRRELLSSSSFSEEEQFFSYSHPKKEDKNSLCSVICDGM